MTPDQTILHIIGNTEIQLLAQKCAFLPQYQTLIIADVHIGKVMHFRRNGIPIPKDVEQQNLRIIEELIDVHQAKSIIFLGDLFHSKSNIATAAFLDWMQNKKDVEFILVIGNHDRYTVTEAQETIHCTHSLHLGDLWLTHEPVNDTPENLYNLAGHIHPTFILKAKGHGSISLPCFYFGKTSGLLPSFGQFTGGFHIENTKGSTIYIVADNKVIPWQDQSVALI